MRIRTLGHQRKWPYSRQLELTGLPRAGARLGSTELEAWNSPQSSRLRRPEVLDDGGNNVLD